MQYLAQYRLYKFNKALPHFQSISEAAIDSGLFHLGRVSTNNRKLFGYTPQEYLKLRS